MPDKQLPVAGPNDPAVVVPSQPLPRIPGLPVGMLPTRHCPSCESGMNAPGTRHSLSAAKGKLSSCLILSSRRLRMWRTRSDGDVPYSPSLGPEPADLGDVDMELPPQVSSAPAEAASFRSQVPPNLFRKMWKWKLKHHRRSP